MQSFLTEKNLSDFVGFADFESDLVFWCSKTID